MEGPVASVQISQEAARGGDPTPGPATTPALGLLRLSVQLLQVRAPQQEPTSCC